MSSEVEVLIVVQEANTMETEKAERLERIKTKTKQLQDLILQQIAFKVNTIRAYT